MMSRRLTGPVVLGILFLAISASAGEPFKAKPLDLTAADVADMLGIRWWKHRLEFDPAVTEVTGGSLRTKAHG